MEVYRIACVILVTAFPMVQGTICYECNGEKSIDDCHNTVSCDIDFDKCYMDVSGQRGDLTYNLGCRTQALCSSNASMDSSSGAIVGCHECCDSHRCNKALCASVVTRSVPNCDANCSDDPSFDCHQVDEVYGICHDIQNAKAVCRKFCGICCQVDGAWSDWSSWGDCSATCGNGTIARRRTCVTPYRHNGGVDCQGASLGLKPCSKQECPTWSEWGNWTVCSASCGGGVSKRYRSCDIQGQCQGDDIDFKVCNAHSCATWSAWTSWSPCSHTCGGGLSDRLRNCSAPQPTTGVSLCVGPARENQLCNTNLCPVDGQFGEWHAWTECSITCGKAGTRTRVRQCIFPTTAPHGNDCVGSLRESESCDAIDCPESGFWEAWGRWHRCSATCGGGTRTRTRSCAFPPHIPSTADNYCKGDSHDREDCNTQAC